MATVAAILFFASIVLHELGHAVQARRDGVVIAGITLSVLGGVASLRGEPPSAGAELRIALAGPGVSLALAPPVCSQRSPCRCRMPLTGSCSGSARSTSTC